MVRVFVIVNETVSVKFIEPFLGGKPQKTVFILSDVYNTVIR